MGRFKQVEIEGLLIQNFGKMLMDSLEHAISSSGLKRKDALKKLAPGFNDILSGYGNSIADLYLEKHKFKLDTFLNTHFRNQRKIAKSYSESFVPYILYLNACYIIYDGAVNKVKRKRIDNTLKITLGLYGLVIRKADQVLHQLLAGYIDGAMILWRSLYENAIVLLTLALECNDELSLRFLHHSVRNDRKKVNSYDKHHKELNFKPMPPSNNKNLQSRLSKMNDKYGKDFLEAEYGWADILYPDKQKASLRLLEERVKLSRFRPYYLMCTEHAHPGFNSFRNYMEGNKIILPRITRQEFEFDSFIDPLQFTLSILHELNDYMLFEFSIEDERNVNDLLLLKIFEKQQASFTTGKKRDTLK